MTIARVNPTGWSVGDKFSSNQCNGLDINLASCIDKTASGNTPPGTATGGDTIAGIVHVGGASSSLIIDSTSSSGLVVATGGKLTCNGAATIAAGGSLTCGVNSALTVSGAATCTLNLSAGSGIAMTSTASLFTTSACTVTLNLGISSSIATSGGGLISLGGINEGASDIKFGNAQTYSRRFPLVPLGLVPNWEVASYNDFSVYTIAVTTNGLSIPILKLHQGATIISVTLSCIIASAGRGASLPAVFPGFNVMRKRVGVIQDLYSGSTKYFPTPASVAAYEDGGNVQTWSIITDQNSVIDYSSAGYTYWVYLQDEQGANAVAGNKYYDMTVVYGNVTDARFQ